MGDPLMTETPRLRWEPLSNGDALGYVTPGQWLYEICKPSDDADDDELALRSRLPGQAGTFWHGNDRGELEREAEGMLADFTASLGAIFPAGIIADLRSRANELEAMVGRTPAEERDSHLFAAGLKRAADLIEHGDQPAVQSAPAKEAGQ
jgi:hypothetical protein